MIDNQFTYSFNDQLKSYQEQIESELSLAFTGGNKASDLTKEAALYSLLAGGKRIRPVLMLAVSELLGVPAEVIIPFACAIEMIHTYSLIHDDLPCMDNDDTRRGKPTCHVKYSEPIALLAGDALLNRAYELLFTTCLDGKPGKIKAAELLAQMAGIQGMIGGQTIDLLSEGKQISRDQLTELHQKKTGCLLMAATLVPAYIYINNLTVIDAGNSPIISGLSDFSAHMGLAFQIKDDLLDVTSDKATLGKSIGKDAKENKSTFVTIYGIEQTKEALLTEIEKANSGLEKLDQHSLDTRFLKDLNHYLLIRNK